MALGITHKLPTSLLVFATLFLNRKKVTKVRILVHSMPFYQAYVLRITVPTNSETNAAQRCEVGLLECILRSS